MDSEIKELLNIQICKELQSAYIYLDFNNFFRKNGLDGYAHYYYIQVKEELDHAILIYDYLHSNNERVKLLTINESSIDTNKSIIDILKYGLEVEQDVTKSIDNICQVAEKKNDYRTLEFLSWFVKEQVEEEANARKMIDDASTFTDASSLFSLNEKYSKRVYSRQRME